MENHDRYATIELDTTPREREREGERGGGEGERQIERGERA